MVTFKEYGQRNKDVGGKTVRGTMTLTQMRADGDLNQVMKV